MVPLVGLADMSGCENRCHRSAPGPYARVGSHRTPLTTAEFCGAVLRGAVEGLLPAGTGLALLAVPLVPTAGYRSCGMVPPEGLSSRLSHQPESNAPERQPHRGGQNLDRRDVTQDARNVGRINQQQSEGPEREDHQGSSDCPERGPDVSSGRTTEAVRPLNCMMALRAPCLLHWCHARAYRGTNV